mgnify:CR=1 FL=1
MSASDGPRPVSGPGETKYETREDGTIVKVRWGDPSWTTIHVHLEDALRPSKVAQMLRDAYLEGFADRATLIRRALGADK